MNQEDFDALLERLSDSSEWLKNGCVPTITATMRAAVDELAQLLSNQEIDLVYVQREFSSHDFDSMLLESLDFIADHHVTLSSRSPFINQCKLFGMGGDHGIAESGFETIVVSNYECLQPTDGQRFLRQLKAWQPSKPSKVVVFGQKQGVCGEDSLAEFDSLNIETVRFPGLLDRKDDIPFIIQESARGVGSGLENFEPGAAASLIGHQWESLYQLVSCTKNVVTQCDSGSIKAEDVKSHLRSAKSAHPSKNAVPNSQLWFDIGNNISEIDRMSTSLVGKPFFQSSVATIVQSPLDSKWPELTFLRLVSWAYVMLVERANPNLKIVLGFFEGYRSNPTTVSQVVKSIGMLRTFMQHSLNPELPRNASTIESTLDWFRLVIGKPQPEDEDFEACTESLLKQLNDCFCSIIVFLKKVNNDEYRELTIKQWERGVKTEWPKHRFDKIVYEALQNMGRSDLDPEVVSKKLLNQLKSRLKVETDREDLENVLQSIAEEEIQKQFPIKMPVTGADIVSLGIPQGPEVRVILTALREKFESGVEGKDKLLEFAQELIKAENLPAEA